MIDTKTKDLIHKYYYDIEIGFVSAPKLYEKMKLNKEKVTLKQVSDFIEQQATAQITKEPRKQKKFNTIVAEGPRSNYQIDIMVYDRYTNKNFKYIICVIDVYSRYVSARAVTNRTMTTIMESLKNIFKQMGLPESINCDNEFNKKEFRKYCDDNFIQTFFSDVNEANKNAIVERFNRTLANMLQKVRVATKKYDWQNYLEKVIDNYNNTKHRTIKQKPKDVFNLTEFNEQTIVKNINKFQVGQTVRIKLNKTKFTKGDEIKYSKDLYKIIEARSNKYKLINLSTEKELKKKYKDYELIRGNTNVIPNNDEEEKEYLKERKNRKIKKVMNKEGIDETNKRSGLRERKPKSQLEHSLYGAIKF